MNDRELEQALPFIEWGVPLKVGVIGVGETYACRYCIAHQGLRASEVADGSMSYGDVIAHIEREHKEEKDSAD